MKTSRAISNITNIALITAVMCIVAPFSIPIPVSPVPITLATLIIFLGIYAIGGKRTIISIAIYLLLGITGLPVFSGFSGGIGVLAGPTGGYLFGYLFMTAIAGICIDKYSGSTLMPVAGMAAATVVNYLFGTAWLAVQMNLSFTAALSVGVLPYLIGDALKIAAAAIAGPALRKRLIHIR